jgi:uncharacterized protein
MVSGIAGARQMLLIGALALLLAVVQWAFWGWLRSAWPEWTDRHRRGLVAVLVLSWAAALARDLRLPPRVSNWISWLVGADVVWQLALVSAMLLFFMGRLVAHLALRSRRFVRSAPPAQTVSIDPAPDGDHALRISRRIMLERTWGAVAVGASMSAFGWGMVRGRWEWTAVEVPIHMPRLPAVLDGFTIVQLSDIHVGMFMDDRDLADGLGRIAGLKPDLVVVTGDIIDRDPRYIPLAARHLGAIRARYGVVCIPGNHDYYTGVDGVLRAMKLAGLSVLRNEGKVIAPHERGGIALLGVDDLSADRIEPGRGPDLARALAMVPPDRPTVLLAHQPPFVHRAVGKGVDLQLSGHTHGGQINPGFRIASLLMPYVAGRYDVGGTILYVNRGFGTAGPPTRVGAAPEITRIVLVSS